MIKNFLIKNLEIKKYIFAIFSVLWLCVIYSMSLQPADESAETSRDFGKLVVKIVAPDYMDEYESLPAATLEYIDHFLRKSAHFTEFLILGVLVCCSVHQLGLGRRFIYSVIFCVAAAALDESIQLFVPGRAGMIRDVLLDSAGAFLGVLVVSMIMRWKCLR